MSGSRLQAEQKENVRPGLLIQEEQRPGLRTEPDSLPVPDPPELDGAAMQGLREAPEGGAETGVPLGQLARTGKQCADPAAQPAAMARHILRGGRLQGEAGPRARRTGELEWPEAE